MKLWLEQPVISLALCRHDHLITDLYVDVISQIFKLDCWEY